MKNSAIRNPQSAILKKPHFPFRLGCTSYVYPDAILPNVRKMASMVDDIELVLFQSSDYCNLPDKVTIKELAKLADDYGITYTVHFPIDRKAGSPDVQERRAFVKQAREIIDLTFPLNPFAYLLHFEGVDGSAPGKQKDEWIKAAGEVSSAILEHSMLDASKICVENLGYPIQWHAAIADSHRFSYCLDMGHLWLYGHDWKKECAKYLDRTRVIHLHGVSECKDHISLKKNNLDVIKQFISMVLKKYCNVVTLELFNQQDTFESMDLLEELWDQSH